MPPSSSGLGGVGVMILKDGTILLGKRKGSHGEGEFALPGGFRIHGIRVIM
ncbi:MAG: hypothetical protein HYT98_00825 [Candidatus Sungbacteria bacterium]|nr:hypothetical protein [Candidatus Sungbacteria bacterium]